MTRKTLFLLCMASLITLSAGAAELQYGMRCFVSGGYPSGKGLWDWTEPEQEGQLHWNWGGGASLILQIPVKEGAYFTGEATYAYIRGGQSLDDRFILYTQQSLELAALLKGKLPVKKRSLYLTGGLGSLFPFDARMDGLPSSPEKPVMLCLKGGVDFPAREGKGGEWFISGYFTHAVTSPEYGWVEGSSGSVRINRVDLALTWLLSRKGER